MSVQVEDQASSLNHGSIWVVGCSETDEDVPWKNAQFYMIHLQQYSWTKATDCDSLTWKQTWLTREEK